MKRETAELIVSILWIANVLWILTGKVSPNFALIAVLGLMALPFLVPMVWYESPNKTRSEVS